MEKHLTRISHKPILSFCYIRVNTQFVAKDHKYEGNIPIKRTPQHAMARASTVVREGLGIGTVWSFGCQETQLKSVLIRFLGKLANLVQC